MQNKLSSISSNKIKKYPSINKYPKNSVKNINRVFQILINKNLIVELDSYLLIWFIYEVVFLSFFYIFIR